MHPHFKRRVRKNWQYNDRFVNGEDEDDRSQY